MKRFFIMVVVGVCVSVNWLTPRSPSRARSSGTAARFGLGNDARQYGQHGMWLEYTVFTMRDVNTCPISVAVEAHVPGVASSGLSAMGLFSATVNRQIPVPYSDRWESRGTHEFSIWMPLPDRDHANSSSRCPQRWTR